MLLNAFAGTFADSLYGELTVSLNEGHLELARGDVHAPLEYWNANTFRWMLPITAPTAPTFIKFEITPDNTVTGMYFGLGSVVTLLGRKGSGRAGRGGVAVTP